MSAALEAAHASYAYEHGAPPALSDVSATVPRGAIVGLLGPNGSGKTTLLRLLAGTLTPSSGDIRIAVGDAAAPRMAPLSSLSRREIARRIAVVPQETHAAFDFSVIEMVLMGRYPHLGSFELEGADDLAIARDALAATGTSALEARRFGALSGGEKQRVVIAGALAQRPDILLLDEPTASLDLGFQLEVLSLLADLNRARGVTMVVSTHDLNLAARLCSELVLLKNGRSVAHGPTGSVLDAAAVRALYGVDADVARHPRAGHLTVVPLARV